MDAGLVKSEGFAVDASVIEADASRYHGKAPGEIDWLAPERQTRAVAEFLTALDDEGADADEVAATKTMIKRTDERLELKPERLAADTAYVARGLYVRPPAQPLHLPLG